MQTKNCTKCGIEKSLNNFCHSIDGKYGRASYCNSCKKQLASENYLKNKNLILARNKIYQDEHKIELSIKKHKYQNEHQIEIKKYRKIYHLNHKDKICKKSNLWYLENKEQAKNEHKNYRLSHTEERKNYLLINKEKIKIQRKTYYQKNKTIINQKNLNRIHTNLNYKLSHNLRIRVRLALQNKDKTKRTLELLGCSIDFLKQHLEAKFQPGMNWNNYGYYGWHVDHIRPCASFDLSKSEEQRKCFNYTNLQPLWAKDNFSKKDKYYV